MIVICTLILAIHSIFQPYRLKRVNVVETLYLYILCIMAIMQVLQKNDVANCVCSLLLMSTTAHTFALTLFKAVTFFQKRCKKSCPTRCRHRRDYGSIKQTTDVEESLTFEQKERKNIFDIIFSKSDDFPFWWLFWWIIECYCSALFFEAFKNRLSFWMHSVDFRFQLLVSRFPKWISDSCSYREYGFQEMVSVFQTTGIYIFFLTLACMRRNTRGRHQILIQISPRDWKYSTKG